MDRIRCVKQWVGGKWVAVSLLKYRDDRYFGVLAWWSGSLFFLYSRYFAKSTFSVKLQIVSYIQIRKILKIPILNRSRHKYAH